MAISSEKLVGTSLSAEWSTIRISALLLYRMSTISQDTEALMLSILSQLSDTSGKVCMQIYENDSPRAENASLGRQKEEQI